MKAGTIIISVIVAGALMAVAVMVKYATDINVEDRQRMKEDPAKTVFKFSDNMGVISLDESNSSLGMSKRFAYVAAITRNYSYTWSFACFASVILVKWIVTSAHCRTLGSTHRVLLYYDFVRNYTHTYPILVWITHQKYQRGLPTSKNDIAIAKLNLKDADTVVKSSYINEDRVTSIEASIWKTVSTMDKRLFLTNDFEKFDVRIAPSYRCRETFGITLDDSLFCVDMSMYREDCFASEFGPIYSGDKIVGILAVKPTDCDIKLAIFTNVSYYTNWILKATETT